MKVCSYLVIKSFIFRCLRKVSTSSGVHPSVLLSSLLARLPFDGFILHLMLETFNKIDWEYLNLVKIEQKY